MTTYVLDSSAVIRYLDNAGGASKVNAILKDCVNGRCRVCISAVQWGEIAGNLRKRAGQQAQARILDTLLPSEVEIVPATAERAVRAAELRVDRKIAYADGFALELATYGSDNVLVTADYGFKVADDLARIEYLPGGQ